MFNTKRALDVSVEVKQVKKTLPYTISYIGNEKDLNNWKKQQLEKERIWQLGALDRYASKRSAATDILLGITKVDASKTQADIAYEAYNRKLFAPRTYPTETKEHVKRNGGSGAGILQLLINKCLSWFLDVKFNH